jgi:hypothetical protein
MGWLGGLKTAQLYQILLSVNKRKKVLNRKERKYKDQPVLYKDSNRKKK